MTCRCCTLSSALLANSLLWQASSAGASDIVDYATVIDGDTLLIREVGIRLAGIDAPELSSKVQRADKR